MWAIAEAVQDEISRSTDRACAIIGASYVESRLEECLRRFVAKDKAAVDDALNSGCLQTFSMKINFAYLAGMISKEFRDDLHVFRKVRNRFAHDLAELTFDDQQLSAWIANVKKVNVMTLLEAHVDKKKPVARRQFENAVGEAGGILTDRFNHEIVPFY